VSALEQQLVEYLTVRRALGFKLVNVELLLRQFVRYLDQLGEQRITINTALAWAVLPGGSDSLHYGRLAAVRGFATHLRVVDPSVEIPGVELLRNGPPRRRPFLYTEEEILALIDACGMFRTAHRTATYRTLIGLLASTGIRVGEAIGLDRENLDLAVGVIVVRGKLDKLRELPLSSSTTAALRAYLARHDRPPSPPGERALFVSMAGTRVAIDGVEQTFALLRDRAGVPSRGGRRPTVHGLRHTFAIRTMLDAYRDGADAGARLGILSTYLGHVEPANTYWYLHAAPELMSAAADRLERYEEHAR
jgi:integrase